MFSRSPKRRKAPKMGVRQSSVIECRGHRQWVAGHYCCIAGRVAKEGPMAGEVHVCEGRIDPHHVKTRGAGGGDEQVAPLCRRAHNQLDSPGWSQPLFERAYSVDLAEVAADLWRKSKHRITYERKQEKEG